MNRLRWFAAFALTLLGWGSQAQAGEVMVAVAANFAAPMQRLAQLFERDTGHRARLTVGSTGNFHAQIRHGAPFDVLLSADDETPKQLEASGLAVNGSRFTYAVGRLVLWSRQPGLVDASGTVLRSGQFRHIALANPSIAPYGAAALEVMGKLGVAHTHRPKFIQGDNIAQTFQFVATGNAELGFIALSQLTLPDGRPAGGSWWVVPSTLHQPIRQDAVILARARDNPAADALLQFLRGKAAEDVIRSYGYER